MNRTSLVVALLCLAIGAGAAYYWSRGSAPAPVNPAGTGAPQGTSLGAPATADPAPDPTPAAPTEPAPAAPGASAAATPAPPPQLPPGHNPAAPGTPARPLNPADPAAVKDPELRSGKGGLHDPMNSGLRRN